MKEREWKYRLNEVPSHFLPAKMYPLLRKLCEARGLKTQEEVEQFLAPRLESLTSPFKMAGVKEAIELFELLPRNVPQEESKKIIVFGDYDVDGTTGAALLYLALREFGYEVEVIQPDRFKDGYGLNVNIVRDITKRQDIHFLMTVDCGITSFEAISVANEASLKVVVIDHHQVDPIKGIPQAHAVINPQRIDCPSGLRELCGCGVAFYFLRALRSFGKEAGWWEQGFEPNLKKHLDLVTMATAADLVPLVRDNHTLVRHGLNVLTHTQKPGVRALLEKAGVHFEKISPSSLGFAIGPRINASGRMASASLAFRLLVETQPLQAVLLAEELEKLNTERAKIQNEIWDKVRSQVEDGLLKGKYENAIVVWSNEFHEGVVGIVASRVVENYHRPAVVLSVHGDKAKGSLRTFAGKDILAGLRECHELLLSYGGHKHAAGVALGVENLLKFEELFDQKMKLQLEDKEMRPIIIDGDVDLNELSIEALAEVEKMGPFGPGNPEPVFKTKARVSDYRILKERHLKLVLEGNSENSSESSVDAIWFHAAEKKEIFDDPVFHSECETEWVAVPELNRFRGRVTASLRIKDWRSQGSVVQA